MKMPITSWRNLLDKLGYRVDWKAVEKIRARRYLARKRQAAELQFQTLEPRQLLALSHSVSLVNGELQIWMEQSFSDSLLVSSQFHAGVNFISINGSATNLPTASVTSMVVNGSPQDDRIDLRGVSRLTFPNLESGAVTIYGGDGNDEIFGPATGATIYGGAGDDVIYGGPQADQIFGGDGNDVIYAGGGDNFVSGGAGDDLIFAGSGNNTIHGDDGNDEIYGGDGDDIIHAGTGNNILSGGDGNDVIYGGPGDDVLRGGAGDDILYAGSGNNVLDGGAGDDQLWGGPGDDTFAFNGNTDLGLNIIYQPQGTSVDTLDFSGLAFDTGVQIDLGNKFNPQLVAGSTESGLVIQLGSTANPDWYIENVIGSSKSDVIIGNELDNRLEGHGGDDLLIATVGSNELIGGKGNNTFQVGSLTPTAPVTTRLEGGDGDDHYIIIHDAASVHPHYVTILNQGGEDTIDFSQLIAFGVTIDLSAASVIEGANNLDVVLDPQSTLLRNAIGTEFDDTLIGNQFDNRLEGRDGNDILIGGGGDNILLGEAGFNDPEVIDQADDQFTSSSGWESTHFPGGFNRGQLSVAGSAEVGLQTASWTFTNLPPGKYEVFVTWAANPDDLTGGTFGATNAIFQVSADGWQTSDTVNQRQSPTGNAAGGVNWTQLAKSAPADGIVTVDQGSLTVTLSNLDADGHVYADAVRIVKYNQAPIFDPVQSPVSFTENQPLHIPLTATDPDGPDSELTFSLAGNSPQGLAIVSDGPGSAYLSWPIAGRPQGKFGITVHVTDSGLPARTITQTFFVQLGSDTSDAPAFAQTPITNLVGGVWDDPSNFEISVDQEVAVSFDVNATGNQLTFSLAPGAPAGATIDSSGQFSWTPTSRQSSYQPYLIEIRATDQSHPPRRISQVVSIKVNDINHLASFVGPISFTNESGVNPIVSGTISNDRSFEHVRVLLKLSSSFVGVEDIEIPVAVIPSPSDPSQGTFSIELDRSHFSNGNGGYTSLTVKARIEEYDPINNIILEDENAYSNSLTIALDPALNQLPTFTFELKNDFGPTGEPMSTTPTVRGTVENPDGAVAGLVVRVYLGAPHANAGLLETLRTDQNGNFEFTVRNLDTSQTVNLTFVAYENTAMGLAESEPAEFCFLYVLNTPPEITSIALKNDTGASSTDGITSDSTVIGTITHADGPLGGITIEFDDNDDGVIDGAAITDEFGNFSYRPTRAGTDAGSFLSARAIEWDNYRLELVASEWLTGSARLALQFDPSARLAPGIISLQPAYPLSEGAVADPTVVGTVSTDNGGRNVAIEFSLIDPTDPEFDRNQDVIGAVLPNDQGSFEFRPGGLEGGTAHTVYARAIEWIPAIEGGVEWWFDNNMIQSTTFVLSDSPMDVTVFGGISLLYDSGANTNNLRTNDPTVYGTIVYPGDYSQLEVEFRFENSDEIIGTAIPDNQGNFYFTPTDLEDQQTVTLQARVRVPDFGFRPVHFDDQSFGNDDYVDGYSDEDGWNHSLLDQWLEDVFNSDYTEFEGAWYNSGFDKDWDEQFSDFVTDWESLTYTLDVSENLLPTVQSLELLYGSINPVDPTIVGTITNDGNVAGLKVEIWVNGRDQADGTATTDHLGQFTYTMVDHTIGENQVVVKIYEPVYGSDDFTIAQSNPLPISIAANQDFEIVNLELKFGTYEEDQWQAIDPTLVGTVVGEGNLAAMLLRFDFNGDGIIDAQTRTDVEGNFEFTPQGLSVDPTTQLTTVHVQAVREVTQAETDHRYRSFSQWSSITWEVLPNTAPQITLLELRNDTLSSDQQNLDYQILDRVTSNPILVGQVINDNGLVELTVEFDHNGDGNVDGTAVTDENGFFEYKPLGLELGGHDIRARVREYNPVTDQDLMFDYWPADVGTVQNWASITPSGNPVIDGANPIPVFYGFTLVPAVAADMTSLDHVGGNTDPTLTGTVSDPDGSDSTVVEFFQHGPGDSQELIGSIRPNADGTFRYTPVGLAFATGIVISARVKKFDYETNGDLIGANQPSVTFNFQAVTSPQVLSLTKRQANDPFDTTIRADVSVNQGIRPLFVEIEIDGEYFDSVAVDFTENDPNNPGGFYFQYRPQLKSQSDDYQIRARVVGRDDNGYRFGNWTQPFSLTYNLNLPTIGDRMEQDPGGGGDQGSPGGPGLPGGPGEPGGGSSPYGWDIEDDHKSTPKIVGQFEAIPVSTGATVTQMPLIEFDLDGDGQVDESVTASETDTPNVYAYSHTFRNLPPGTIEMRVRVTRYENVNLVINSAISNETSSRSESILGDWKTITFELQDPAPAIEAESLALVNEIGSDPIPKAYDPAFTGQIQSVGSQQLVGFTIEVDHTGDGNVNGTTITMADGSFHYRPVDLSRDVDFGVVTLLIRAVDPYTQEEPLVGPWTEFTFNFLSIDIPTVTSLSLKFNEADSGTPTAADPTLIGVVAAHETAGLITIEFDHNGDGEVDGTARANFLGEFTYRPQNLQYGIQTIRARTVAQSGNRTLRGEFAEISDPEFATSAIEFFYTGAQPPAVADLEIANQDNGKVTGRLTSKGFGVSGRVEIAVLVDDNPVSNGIAFTDSFGYFQYVPQELIAGTVTLEARGILGDPISSQAIVGQWQAIGNFEYAPPALPSTLPDISEFKLLYDTGTNPTDLITADATLVGKVNSLLPGMWIDISYDNFQTITTSVRPQADGTFSYQPTIGELEGHSNEPIVSVRNRVWNPHTGTYQTGTSTQHLSFTYDPTANLPAEVSVFAMRDNIAPSGQTQTSNNPVFVGQVTNDGPLGGLTVLFDHNGNGIPDGSTTTRPDGSFTYRAIGMVASGSVQSIVATVVERDYRGVSIHGGPTTQLDFVLSSAPLVTSISFTTDSEPPLVMGTVSTPGSTSRHIEYQVFGNYSGSADIPTSPSDFVPGSILRTGSVSGSHQFTIALFNELELGPGPAAVMVRVIDDTNQEIGPWELLHFNIAASSLIPQTISNFGLVEDTGTSDSDGITSNPTVTGKVGSGLSGAYALVEFTVVEIGTNEPNQIYRATANREGVFVWTPPDLAVGNQYEIEARHVVYDPTIQQETLGSPTVASLTLLNNNLQATVLNFGLVDNSAPITDPTLSGTVQNDGQIAGLRVEYDIHGNEEADGFTFTDANGQFQFTLYDLTAGQPTTVRVRVVEWDGIANDFIHPDFADVGANQTVTFTLEQDGPTSPELGSHFNGNETSSSLADTAALDAVFSQLADAELGDSMDGSIDVGIGHIRLGVQDISGAVETGNFGSNPLFTPAASRPTSNVSINQQNVPINGLVTIAGAVISADGSNDSHYSFTKTIVIGDVLKGGLVPITTNITYHLVVASYTSSAQLNGSTSSLQMTTEYSFTFSSTVNYSNDNIASGSYSLTQQLASTYLRSSSTTTDEGSSSSTSAGSLTWEYEELNSVFSGGTLTQPYSASISRFTEHWSDRDQTSSQGSGFQSTTQGSSSTHSASTITISDSGTITVSNGLQSVVGTLVISANGNANHNFQASTSFSSNYSNQSTSSGTLSIIGGGQQDVNLWVTTSYQTDQSVNSVWYLDGSSQSTVSLSGSGQGSNSTTYGSTQQTWIFNATSSVTSQLDASGVVNVDLSTPSQPTTFSSSANVLVEASSSGSASGTVNHSSNNGEGNSQSASGQFSTSFSRTAVATSDLWASGTDDLVTSNVRGSASFTGNYTSTSQVSGTTSTPKLNANFGSINSSSVNLSGTSGFEGTQTPDLIESSGYSSVFGEATVLEATQSYGTITTDEGTVPFRNNRASQGQLSVSGSVSGDYRRNLNAPQEPIQYSVWGNFNQNLAGSVRESKYIGIIGRLSGFALEKSQGEMTERTAVSAFDENGTTRATGSISSTENGKINTLVSVSGTDTSIPGTTFSISLLDMKGGKYHENFAGMFEVDPDDSVTLSGAVSFSQHVNGLSVSTMSMHRIDADSHISINSTDRMKYLASAKGNGAAIIKDDVVLAENGSFSSQRLARLESNQSVMASSSFNENGSSGHSMISFNTNAKFTLKDNESVRWTTIGQTEHSHGGFSSESRGNVDTDGSMVGTVKTETTDLIESVTLGSSFSSGAAIEDKLGGYFINSIIVVNANGGDSSYSQESSTISISQVREHGSQQQTVTSVSSSSDRFTYSIHLMQFGEILGSESGSVSLSSDSQDVTKISSSGNWKLADAHGWESRTATISTSDHFSASAQLNQLIGSFGGAGDQTDGPLGSVQWSISSGQSITGTRTEGSVFQYGGEGSTINGQATVVQGFNFRQSTQNLAMSDKFSASDTSPVPIFTESFSVDGINAFITYLVTTPVSSGSGGGDPGGGDPGEPGEPGGGSTPSEPIGGGGSDQWTIVYSTSEVYGHLITLDTEIQGDKVSRAISHAHTGYRDTWNQTITPDQRNGSAYITRWGKATDYIGVDGHERLVVSDIVSVTGLTFHEDFIEASVEYENGRMLMNNWVDASTFTYSNLFIATKAPLNPIRFSNRATETTAHEIAGSVDHSEKIEYPTAAALDSTGSSLKTVTATRLESNVNSQSVLTSGLYGREPTRRVVTDRTTQSAEFEATTTFESDVTTTLHDGDHHHKSNSKNWEKENSHQQTVNKVTIHRGKVSSSRSAVFNELEMSTHYSTFTSTPPTGTPLTGTAHGAHLRVFHSTQRDYSPARGFELTVGYNYDSLLQYINPDGTSSHWQFYSSSTFFPEGGSSQPNPNLTANNDDSYNPNSRRQDGEGNVVEADPKDQPSSDEVAKKFLLFAITYPEEYLAFVDQFEGEGVARLAKAFEWGYWIEFGRDAYWFASWNIENGATIVIDADNNWLPTGNQTPLQNAIALDRALREGMQPRPEKFWRNEWVPLIRNPSMDGSSYAELTTTWNGLKLSEAWRNRANLTEEMFRTVKAHFVRHATEYLAGLSLGAVVGMARQVAAMKLSHINFGGFHTITGGAGTVLRFSVDGDKMWVSMWEATNKTLKRQGIGGRTLFEEALRKFPNIKEIRGIAELDNLTAYRATGDIIKTPFALSLKKLGFTHFEVLEVGADVIFIATR